MGKTTDQWYAIDHVVTENGSDQPAATSQRTMNRGAVTTGASTANGTSVGSRLWTSARRATLMAAQNGTDSEVTHGNVKALENGKASIGFLVSPVISDLNTCMPYAPP
ncbi:hypothetical protein ACTXT7_016525 [Hymenolepis weldensis]